MELTPKNTKHALQILSGVKGRKRGHEFEFELASSINKAAKIKVLSNKYDNLFIGSPEIKLIERCLKEFNWKKYDKIEAIPLGALATNEDGKNWLKVNGIMVKASKSDILINIYLANKVKTIGISVKQCLAIKPTNAQLFLSTARGFCKLLRRNNIHVSQACEFAMRQFCGDIGFRPLDNALLMRTRKSNPVRFYWEELEPHGRFEWENIFTNKQNEITKMLLQKSYLDDPFPPEILIHKTKKVTIGSSEFALYGIDELVDKSCNYAGFIKTLKTEVSKSKSYRVPKNVKHECPKFGVVQMQRFGNKQNATQLQFNLQAGYFYKI